MRIPDVPAAVSGVIGTERATQGRIAPLAGRKWSPRLGRRRKILRRVKPAASEILCKMCVRVLEKLDEQLALRHP